MSMEAMAAACVDVDACLRWVVAGPRFQGSLCDEGGVR